MTCISLLSFGTPTNILFPWFCWIIFLCMYALVLFWFGGSFCSSFSFLKTALLNSLPGPLQISVLGISFWKITVILWSCHFSCLFMFLEVLHCGFYIWQSHLLQSLLAAFSREKTSIITARDSEAFSAPLYSCSVLLAPSCGRTFKLKCLLLIL